MWFKRILSGLQLSDKTPGCVILLSHQFKPLEYHEAEDQKEVPYWNKTHASSCPVIMTGTFTRFLIFLKKCSYE